MGRVRAWFFGVLASFCAVMAQGQQRGPEMIVEANGGRTGILITDATVTVDISGDVALVEQALTWQNPFGTQLRGDLRFPLPDGVTVSGYSLDIFGQQVEGVAIGKDRARTVFESYVNVRRDPGLVEWQGENLFATRVFPIPPHGNRHITISYVQQLPREDGALVLDLPFFYEKALDSFALTVRVHDLGTTARMTTTGGLREVQFVQANGVRTARLEMQNTAVNGRASIRLSGELPTALVERSPKGNRYFVIRDPRPEAPGPEAAQARTLNRVCLFMDVSGSMSGKWREDTMNWMGALVKAAGVPEMTVELVPFHGYRMTPVTVTLRDGDAGPLLAEMEKLATDGATNLSAVGAVSTPPDLYLVMTDGRHSLGAEPDWSGMTAPVYALTPGGNTALLAGLVRRSGGEALDLYATSFDESVERVLRPRPHLLAIDAPGGDLRDLHVNTAPQNGGRFEITGTLLAIESSVSVVYGVDLATAERYDFTLNGRGAPRLDNLRRFWAVSQFQALMQDPVGNRQAITELGETHTLVTPYTSLIVLESVDQYVRWRIVPPASMPQMRSDYFRQVRDRDDRRNTNRRDFERSMDAYAINLRQRLAFTAEDVARQSEAERRAAAEREARRQRIAQEMESVDPNGMDTAFFSVPAGVFFGGETRESFGDVFGDDDDDDDDDAGRGGGRATRGQPAVSAGGAPGDQAGFAIPAGPTVVDGATTADIMDLETDYMQRLRSAPTTDAAYRAYLGMRHGYQDDPSYYMNCGIFFRQQGATALALRILCNLAEFDTTDLQPLLMLGRVLGESDQTQMTLDVYNRMLQLFPDNVVVGREFVQALQQQGQHGLALRTMADFLTGTEDSSHFRSDHMVLFSDLIQARQAAGRAGASLPPISSVRQLILNPQMRVVLTCPDPGADIDLWVTNPREETVYSEHWRGQDAGFISVDAKGRLGLEEYILQTPLNGDYTLRAYYAGAAPDVTVQPVVVFVDVYLQVGTPDEEHRQFTVQLNGLRDIARIATIRF